MDGKGSRKKTSAQTKNPVVAEAPPPTPPRDERPPPRVAPPRPAAPVAPAPRPESLLPPRPVSPVTKPAPFSRFSATPSAPAAPRPFFAPVIAPGGAEETEHRLFPRALLATNVEVWIEDAGVRRFTATLRSVNVSVGGAFLESTFFLPMDTELRVRFSLEPGAPPVEARARIVREQRPRREEEPSGFGIRFEEFYGQTEVALARLFLDTRLRAFAEEYLRSPRARGLSNELERVVDALAAWELLKAHTSTDTWRGE
ncbi:PilZ domain-containing protein [Melittangium boletus]|uniref:PilZ domain-containing protein n=1 Tax=Melittangium boletus DSM 14713 TaxID=1294270 RepID=A0A250I7I1_9BACT|nr:PilZ domain-containing protein [Melittangium boletus]ATB27143.1 hypothetical protein MEBOL_000581 [Melittangium boletus DSM 14713]